MAIAIRARAPALGSLILLACGGSDTTPRLDRADATADSADARPDQDEPSVWSCAEGRTEVSEYQPGRFLDLTLPAEMQTGAGSSSSIGCFKQADDGLSSWGGVWFQSWRDPEAPGTGASFAAGETFVLESPSDDDLDLTVTPPLPKQIGDTVGPDDDWVSGEDVSEFAEEGVQVAHIQDPGDTTAMDQIWFMSGIVGVRFTAADGVHYGFVELEFEPDDRFVYLAEWPPVRWGYHPEPDAAFTIPP